MGTNTHTSVRDVGSVLKIMRGSGSQGSSHIVDKDKDMTRGWSWY